MARTNKKQARVNKQRSSKLSRHSSEIPKITSLDHWLEIWAISKRENPLWRTYHRYDYWRWNCYETWLKCDRDWYRYLRRFWSFVVSPMSWWIRSKLRG